MRYGCSPQMLKTHDSSTTRGLCVPAVLAALAFAGCGNAQFGGTTNSRASTPGGAIAGPNPNTSEPVPTSGNNPGVPTLGSNPGSTSTTTNNTNTNTTANNTTNANSSGGLAGLINTIGQIVSTSTMSSTNTNTNTQNTTANTNTSAYPIPSNLTVCSQMYGVPATANPYLAGDTTDSTLTYTLNSGDPPTPTDTVAEDSPVLVAPTNTACIAPGATLAFTVSGGITYSHSEPLFNANGNVNMVVQHQLGSVNGISNIAAPISSLLGVFLTDADPSTAGAAPAGLDFSTQAARDYLQLQPAIGQVFFIGDGVTSGGQFHQVVVPQGATRLFFATMDEYQWNNNVGGVSGAILTGRSN